MTLQSKTAWLALAVSAFILSNCRNIVSSETPLLVSSPSPTNILPTSYSTLLPPTSTPFVLESDLLTRYGWTISRQILSHTITLPKSFQHYPGDFPYAIYWAYNNEFNKDIGMDLAPYLGQTVQASLYLLNEPLPKEFYPYVTAYAVIIKYEKEIIGAWIDRGRHYGFACSLNRKNFEEIVNQKWNEWLLSAGVVEMSNELDRELSQKTPEEIIEIYYKAMNEGDYQLLYSVRSRWSLAGDLFRNKDDLALFNYQGDPINIRAVDNIESVHLVNIEEAGFSRDCYPVYGASVIFQFANPVSWTIPEGENLRFVVLNEEIEGLGWRVEEVNTSPGGSYDQCTP